MKISRFSKVLPLLFLSACSTPYKPNGFTGGFADRQLAEDTYRVSFRGNGFTNDERAADFLMLRCAELTLQHGAHYFRLVGSQDTSQNGAVVLQGTTTGTGTATTYGNTTYVQGQSTTSPGFVMPVHFPRQTAIIQFRQSREATMDLNAQLISDAIRKQYGIR